MRQSLLVLLGFVCLALISCESPMQRYERGNTSYLRGNYQEALDHYLAARQSDPSLTGIDGKIRETEYRMRIQEGDTAVQQHQWGVAEQCFQAAERLQPGSEEVQSRFRRLAVTRASHHFQSGQDFLARGNPFEAVVQFEATLTYQPNHPRAAGALTRARSEKRSREVSAESAFQDGQSAWTNGSHEEGLRHYRRAADLNPNHLGARRELADAEARVAAILVRYGDDWAKNREWQRALDAYQRAQNYDPGHRGLSSRILRARSEQRAVILVAEADGAFTRGDWQRALERYEEAGRLTEDTELFRSRHEEAREKLAVVVYEKAQAAERDGRYDEALSIYESIRTFHPEYRDVVSRRDRLSEMLETAKAEYSAGCNAQDRRDIRAAERHFVACGEAISRYRDIGERLELIRRELARAEDFYRRALGAETRGEIVRARVLFEECLSVSTPYRDAVGRIGGIEATEVARARAGRIYTQACRAQEARDLQTACKLFRSCQQIRKGYRDTAARMKKAEVEFATALEILNRARQAEKACQLERARVLYEECLEISSPCGDAQSRLQRLGDAVVALKEAEKLHGERRLLAARKRYAQVLAHYKDCSNAHTRLREIDGVCNTLSVRYQSLQKAQRSKKFRVALTIALEIQGKCVGFKDVDARVVILRPEADYADGRRFEAQKRYKEAARFFARCAEGNPKFRDVQARLRHCRSVRVVSDDPIDDPIPTGTATRSPYSRRRYEKVHAHDATDDGGYDDPDRHDD